MSITSITTTTEGNLSGGVNATLRFNLDAAGIKANWARDFCYYSYGFIICYGYIR